MCLPVALFALCISSLTAWCAESPSDKSAAELHTLKGDVLKGDLADITDKEITLQQSGKSVVIPLAQALRLDFTSNTPIKLDGTYSDVELTDGSLFHCKEWTIKEKQVELKTLAGQAIKLPLTAVANILNDAQNPNYRKDWSERLARKRRRDLVAVIKDEAINAIEGTVGEADAEGKNIEFQIASGRKGKLLLANLHGIIFQRELDPQAPPVVCKLLGSYQDFLMVSGASKTRSGLAVTTPAGAKIEVAFDQVTRLDYTLDKLAFLSRLEPSKVVHKQGYVEESNAGIHRDKNLDNGPLRIYDEDFAIGLALHADTELEYDLKGDYREFHALAGIDQSVGGVGGPVVLLIEGVIDGETKQLYKKTFSRKDAKDRKEGAIDLNIKDVQKLRIIVRTGDLLDTGKHLDLVNAKVQK